MKSNRKKIVSILFVIVILLGFIGRKIYLNSTKYKLGDGSALQRSQYFLNEEFAEDWNFLYEEEVYRVNYEGGWAQIKQGVIDTEYINVWGGNFKASLRGRDVYFRFYYPLEKENPTIRGTVLYDQGELEIRVSVKTTTADGHADNRGYYVKRGSSGNVVIREATSLSEPEKEYEEDDSAFRNFNGGISAEEVLTFVEEQYYGYVEKLDILTEKYFPGYLETLSDEQRLKFTYA